MKEGFKCKTDEEIRKELKEACDKLIKGSEEEKEKLVRYTLERLKKTLNELIIFLIKL